MVYYLIALIAFLVDQGTKYLIAKQLQIGEEIPIIGHFFVITSSRNQGAAFGILQGKRWFFIVITIAVVIGIVWYMERVKKNGQKLLPVALSLILGGAIGNFLDRSVSAEVVDFLQFTFGSYIFPIFNFADSCIVVGVALIILDTLLENRRDKTKPADPMRGDNHL
ncbi:signal peptidase II [Paenibacillus physcomitrellae]|uniref:Lipoprotein signal peptidase n=1 Tax=Paenibacillus physcomitrellae TaxID=1619311 RepID=A0ABQ1FMM4_9BACL|nr:signal peptidase II [Paenibacillus physcomitrellae]GGA21012.1 lipoprotein signal peptidase [Paenibacillus physcomitrellae]